MIQKMKTYTVKRASSSEQNDYGEIIESFETFPIQMLISVSTGNRNYNNLIQSTNSTHVGVYYSDYLTENDLITDEDGNQFVVTFSYPKAAKKIVDLRLVK